MKTKTIGLLAFSLLMYTKSYAVDFNGGNRPLLTSETAPIASFQDDESANYPGYTSVTSPSNGTATYSSGLWTYVPNSGFTGTDSWTYTLNGSSPTLTGSSNVLVYPISALTKCKQLGQVNANGTLKQSPKANGCAFYSRLQTRVTPGGSPVTMDYFLNYPSDNVTIKAIVVLIGGADLNMGISGDPSTGIANTSGGGNFDVRTAQSVADAGYITVAINKPSDQPPSGSIDTHADADIYRVSVNHAVDILAIINSINAADLPVYLAGTSAGAVSVVAQNLIASGIEMSSPVSSGSYYYIGDASVSNLLESYVARPTQVLWNSSDLCSASTPTGSQEIYDDLSVTKNYSIVSGGVRVTVSGSGVSPDVCGAFDYHGFLGIENYAVGALTYWLNGSITALGSDSRPEALPATISTPAGTNATLDLSTLASTTMFGVTLSYDLSSLVTSLGGGVSLSGSTVTFVPNASSTAGQTDYFVYVVTDGNGGVSANIVTVNIQ